MNVGLRSRPLNIISLCTGGGGLDLGVDLAMPSARPVAYVEREAFACAHLVAAMRQGLMVEAPLWSDVTTFDGRPWRGLVDGVIGGIPCQPHSLAGKRQGSDDERDLWSDARRIIVQSGAWFVIIENVSGMLSAKPGLDPGALRVRRDLSRLGFDVEAGLFTAAEVGASHERERLFILGVANPDNEYGNWSGIKRSRWRGQYSDGDRKMADSSRAGLAVGQQPAFERGTVRNEWQAVGPSCDGMAHATGGGCRREANAGISPIIPDARGGSMEDSPRSNGSLHPRSRRPGERASDIGRPSLFPPGPSDLSGWASVLASSPELEPAFRRVADGLASRLDIARVDRLRLLGNGVVPLQAAYALRTLVSRLAANGCTAANELVRGMMG